MSNKFFDIWHIAYPVKDLNQSVEYYRDLLGFELIGFNEESDKKQAFISIEKGGFTLELFTSHRDTPHKQPDHLAFNCKDLEKFRSILASRGYQNLPETKTYGNGVKHLALTDPNGIKIEFFQGREIFESSISS